MRWDLVFFLKGYPAKYRFGDKHYFLMAVTAEKLAELATVCRERFPDSAVFFDPAQADQFTAFGYRCEAEDQQAAIDLAYTCLNGFIDGASLILGHELPRHGPVAFIREADDDDARICLMIGPQWSYFDSHDGSSEAWADQAAQIFKQLWPFFDVIAGIHARRETALANQLIYSLQMYRYGVSAALAGVEFICKWSALEGLVSVTERPKRRRIVERLETLFADRKAEIATTVNALWDVRNNAVHEARLSGAVSPMQQLDELFLGVAIFAIAHLDLAESLEQLWSFAPVFQIPSFVKKTRTGRHRILGGAMPAARAIGGGRHIDGLFAIHAQIMAANPQA
jgi:hypothetical protein